jgi:hypothetical protein
MPSSNGPLAIAVKLKAKRTPHGRAVTLYWFTVYKNNILTTVVYFQKSLKYTNMEFYIECYSQLTSSWLLLFILRNLSVRGRAYMLQY